MFYDDKALESLPTVTFAQLHSELFLPNVGQFGRTFDTSPKSQDSKLRGLKMWAGEMGLFVKLGANRACIPYGNVKWCVFTPVGAETATVTVKTTVTPQPTPKPTVVITPKAEEKLPVNALDEKTLAAVKASLAQG